MINSDRCVILGAGGHAKSVLDALLAEGKREPVGILDPDPSKKGLFLLGVQILGGEELLVEILASGISTAVIGIGGTRDNRTRRGVFQKAVKAGFSVSGVVHPRSTVSPFAFLDPSAQILAGATVGPGAQIGMGTIINTASIVEHDCRVGDFVHIASGAVLGGGCSVGKLAHVGSGATILQGVTVESESVIGSGAVVTKTVSFGVTVAGVPAKPISK